MKLIQFLGISKSYGKCTVLRDVEFAADAGEVILITGENGTGKSTLLEVITGQIAADTGECKISGQRPISLQATKLSNTLERIFRRSILGFRACIQAAPLFGSIPLNFHVLLANPFLVSKLNLDQKQNGHKFKQNEKFTSTFINDSRIPSQMSFGERRSFAIERQSAFSPLLCILDEPCAGLDANNIDLLRAQISNATNSGAVTIIIEHKSNISKIIDLIDQEYVLNNGFLEANKNLELQKTRTEDKDERLDNNTLTIEWKPNTSRNKNKKSASEKNFGLRAKVKFNSKSDSDSLPPLIRELANNPINIDKPGVLTIKAPNGWGKSTFCNMLAGVWSAFLVNLELNVSGIDINSTNPKRENLELTVMRSEPVFPPRTKVSTLFSISKATPHSRIRSLLNRYFETLSGGERRFVHLNLVLGRTGTKYYVLDEPLLGLDSNARSDAIEMIETSSKNGVIIIFSPT